MNKTITTSLLMLLSHLGNSQTTNYFVDGSRWVYHNYETWEPGQQTLHSSDEQNLIHGDTILNGISYLKLYTTFFRTIQIEMPKPQLPKIVNYYDSIGPTFIRYDSLLNRVYYLPNVDTTEKLIYNFNLQVGDTVPMQSVYFPPTAVIYSIDTTIIFGVQHKRFFLNPINQFGSTENTNYIIEGIGGTNGLTFYQPEFQPLSGGIYMTKLNCFEYKDSVFSQEKITCPFITYLSETKLIDIESKLSLMPNPTRDLFTIIINEELLNSIFTITDFLGRVVQAFPLKEINSKASLDISGIYFWKVEKNGRLIKTGKIICE
jgi:hypothetical protein